MSIERVQEYLSAFDAADGILEFDVSSATVELAALALGCEGARIAKTLGFRSENGCLMVVTAGDSKIDNAKFRSQFGLKARMLTPEEVMTFTGHPVGGVCPFALPEQVPVYIDVSLKRFDKVYPACGSANSAIPLTCDQLERYSKSQGWVDVCRGWQD